MNAVVFASEIIYCVAKLFKVHVFDNFEGNESFKDKLCVVDLQIEVFTESCFCMDIGGIVRRYCPRKP